MTDKHTAALARLNDKQAAWLEVYTTHTRWQANVYARLVEAVKAAAAQMGGALPYVPVSLRDEYRAAALAAHNAAEEMGDALVALATDYADGWKNYQDYLLETMSTTDGKGQP